MPQPKRIFIIGPTGAGKFMLAESLAKGLGWELIDANPGLERYMGRNLHEILGKQGEKAFHRCEAEIISRCIKKENVVVVLEEAVINAEENRQLLSPEFVVYSKVSTSVQIERWSQGRTPLLPIADLKAFLDKQHLERDSLYEEVTTLILEPTSVENDVNTIMKAIEDGY